MSDIDELFDNMAEAEGSNSGVFFTEGLYEVSLKEVEFRPRGYKGKSVIFRFNVEASSDPANHQVGSTRVWICKLDKGEDQKKRTMSDIKNLMFALLGHDPNTLKSPEQHPKAHAQATALFKATIDPAYAKKENVDPNKVLGRRCKLEATKIMTNPRDGRAPSPYTRHVWGPAAKTAQTTAAA
jgi:hypothetical protein